jgi:hypothetical protein
MRMRVIEYRTAMKYRIAVPCCNSYIPSLLLCLVLYEDLAHPLRSLWQKIVSIPASKALNTAEKILPSFSITPKHPARPGRSRPITCMQGDKGFKSAKEIKDTFAKAKMKLDGVSAHCPFWVHTSAWTGTPSIRPFIPPDGRQETAR